MADKRILIISNNCLSEHNSNGRTLLNLVREFPRENISQIYTSGEITDNTFCGANLRITNREVICSYFRQPNTSMPAQGNGNQTIQDAEAKGNKTAFTMLLRDLAWDNCRRVRSKIVKWAKAQNPDCIILQIGDASLHISIATMIATELTLPLITFNTEDYYFKDYDYMRQSFSSGPIYRIFHHRFCRKFRKMMKLHPTCIYNCDGLKSLYDKEFKTDSQVFYCGTDFKRLGEDKDNSAILYAGNLGVGRHKSLIEIGEELHGISKELYLDVYGDASTEVKEELNHATGIRYHGLVSYRQMCECVRKSRLLIHVESFDKYDAMDTKYAFSTKLADYLASGIPILLYGPNTGEGIRYVKERSAAFVVEGRETLKTELNRALSDKKGRSSVSGNALELAGKNHNMKTNGLLFRGLINTLVG